MTTLELRRARLRGFALMRVGLSAPCAIRFRRPWQRASHRRNWPASPAANKLSQGRQRASRSFQIGGIRALHELLEHQLQGLARVLTPSVAGP